MSTFSIRLLASSCVMCCLTSLHAASITASPTFCLENQVEIQHDVVLGKSLLIDAIVEGNVKLAKELIKSNVDINVADEQGYTPLMIAIDREQISIARALIKAGADVKAHNHIGHTALHRAAYFCQKDIVKMLTKAGADVNAREYENEDTPLLLVVKCYDRVNGFSKFSKSDRKDTAKELIKAGADVNARCTLQFTVLMCAVNTKQKKIVKELIKAGVDVNAQNNGQTALLMAQEKGYQKIADVLIAAGATSEPKVILIVNTNPELQ